MSNQTISRNRLPNDVLKKFVSTREPIPSEKKASKAIDMSSIIRAGVPIKKSLDEKIKANDRLYSSKDVLICFISLALEYSRLKTQVNKAVSYSKIEEYFSHEPSIRAQKRKEYTVYIQSTEDVFKVLELGNTKNIVDGCDSAVDILAECDRDVLTKAIDISLKIYISNSDVEIAKSWEKNWEILIQALTYASSIEPHQKMSLLLSLCDPRHKLSRLVKLALIDAIVGIDIDLDLAKVMLQIFMSERESDSFVRDYAISQPFGERILGQDEGLFSVPKNFNDPLPEDILSAFEG